MRLALDIETKCSVVGCPHHGRSICDFGHSLSPWHSEITVIGLVTSTGVRRVFRGENKLKELSSFLADSAQAFSFVNHNFKFDWLHLAARGLVIPLEKWVGDSQLAAYILTEKIPQEWLAEYEQKRGGRGRKGTLHSLKTLAPFFLGVEPFWEGDDHDSDEYVLLDCEYALRLTEVLETKLKQLGQFDFYFNRQIPWAKMLVSAELRGVALDMAGLEQKDAELGQRAAALETELSAQWAAAHNAYFDVQLKALNARYDAQVPRSDKEKRRASAIEKLPKLINYASHAQMKWLLRDFLGYDIRLLEPKTSKKTGKVSTESTDKGVLNRLAAEGKADVAKFLEWRKTIKAREFLPQWRAAQAGGTLHPIFNPDSTVTGRTSSERPNLQQVPQALRPLIIPRPGMKFIGYDQAAIEAKLITLYTEDPTLYHLISSGASIHDHNTKVWFGLDVPYSEIKKNYAAQRAAAKNVGFALFYFAGWKRIRGAFADKGYWLGEEHYRELHAQFKETYPKAFEFAREVVRFMEEGGVLENLFGRPLKIQDPADAYMKAFNRLVQSSASDLLLHGAMLAWRALEEAGIKAWPVLFVHDFAMFEVEEGRAAEADAILQRYLTEFALKNSLGPIKLEVEGGIMDRWEK